MKECRDIISRLCRLLMCLAFFAVDAPWAVAGRYTVENLPVETFGTRKFVCNPDGVLSEAVVANINSMFQALEDSTGDQVLVIAVDQIEGDDDFQFAHDAFRRYGVGQAKDDNGLVILLVRDLRRIRFVTGYGIEGILPDMLCFKIQQNHMVPYFKNGDWNQGMLLGCTQVYQTLLDGNEFTPPGQGGHTGTWGLIDFIFNNFFLFIILFFVLFSFLGRRRLRCPNCKTKMKAMKTVEFTSGGRRYRRTLYVCPACHRTKTQLEDITPSPTYVPMSGGGYHGGWSGGFGGGGFGGGSGWGGGNSGGGGAGSGW